MHLLPKYQNYSSVVSEVMNEIGSPKGVNVHDFYENLEIALTKRNLKKSSVPVFDYQRYPDGMPFSTKFSTFPEWFLWKEVPERQNCFVFGSNLAGRHGAGSAKAAVDYYGATYGTGVGVSGNTYAIPTKDEHIVSMELDEIKPYVEEFIRYAKEHQNIDFHVVMIGCGLAGFTNEQMAPLFNDCMALNNVFLHPDWVQLLQAKESHRAVI